MLAVLILILGHSMEPTIHAHTLMHRVPTPYSALHLGEIVEYRNDALHCNVSHRIVGGWSGHWVMQGDNRATNPRPDPGYCTPQNYIGEIVR